MNIEEIQRKLQAEVKNRVVKNNYMPSYLTRSIDGYYKIKGGK